MVSRTAESGHHTQCQTTKMATSHMAVPMDTPITMPLAAARSSSDSARLAVIVGYIGHGVAPSLRSARCASPVGCSSCVIARTPGDYVEDGHGLITSRDMVGILVVENKFQPHPRLVWNR